MANFIPKYIRQVVADQSGHRVKATDWNALWNLLITASDHNSETLNSLINLGDIVVNSTAHDALAARVDNLEGAGFISTELDPSVPAWAKKPTKPVYTAAEVGALANTSTLATIPGTSTHRTVSDAEKATWNAKQAALVSGTDYLTPIAISGLYQPKKAAAELYVTAAEKTSWNAKQNALVVGTDYLTAATLASLYEVKRNAEQHYLTTAQQTALHAHSNKTALDLVSGTNTGDQDLSGKQDLLVSGTNIKTINGVSILGSGDLVIAGGEGGGSVLSVNSQTGVVVLNADHIDDTSTAHKFVTATDLTKLSNLSGTNTGDQDLSGYALTGHDHAGVYASALGVDDNYVTDAEKTLLANTSGVNTGDQDLSGYALGDHMHEDLYEPLRLPGDNYVTAAEKAVLANTSGVNTGDQDLSGLAKANTLAYGYEGLTLNDGSTTGWLRTPSSGLIPFEIGGASSSLGTSGWAFSNIYGTALYQEGVRVPRVKWGSAVANPVAGDMYFTA